MSGHSKWSQIKRAKAVTDKKRSSVFTKLAKNISLAAKKGKDPEMNYTLKQAIDSARAANMPKDNIEKAILRGAGELGGAALEEIMYEAYLPGGAALIILTVTDNKNRTASNIKSWLNKFEGKLAAVNSVAYMFQKKGILRLNNESEEAQLKAIDGGALDVINEDGGLTIYTNPQDLERIKALFPETLVEYSALEMVPENRIALLDEGHKSKIQNLLEILDEDEDINEYYTNADL